MNNLWLWALIIEPIRYRKARSAENTKETHWPIHNTANQYTISTGACSEASINDILKEHQEGALLPPPAGFWSFGRSEGV